MLEVDVDRLRISLLDARSCINRLKPEQRNRKCLYLCFLYGWRMTVYHVDCHFLVDNFMVVYGLKLIFLFLLIRLQNGFC